MGTFYDRGLFLYRQSRWALAAEHFQKELAEHPGSVMAQAMLGMSHVQLKRFDAAEDEIREAVRLGPDVGYVYFALAYLTLKRATGLTPLPQVHQAAKQHLEQAIALEPRNVMYHSMLAETEHLLSHWQACLLAADAGLQIQPDHENCLWYRSKALWFLNRESAAEQVIRQSLANNPEQAAGHRLLGWMLLQRKAYADAFEHLDQSLRLDPSDVHAQKNWRQSNICRYFPFNVFWKIGNSKLMGVLLLVYLAPMMVVLANLLWVDKKDDIATMPILFSSLLAGLVALLLPNRIKRMPETPQQFKSLIVESGFCLFLAIWSLAALGALLRVQESHENGQPDQFPLGWALIIAWGPLVPWLILDRRGRSMMGELVRDIRRRDKSKR